MLIDWPETNITPKVAKKAIGIPSATQMAVLRLRNRNRTAKTIQRPLNPFLTNKEILSSIRFAAVLYVSTLIAFPIIFFALAITFSTFSETWRASLVLLLLTHNSTAGLPSTNFKTLPFSTLDFICAISSSVILPPELKFFNSNFLKVSTSLFSPTVLTLSDPSAKLPPDTSWVSTLIKFAIWVNDNFNLAASNWEISIKISSLGRPWISTLSTPEFRSTSFNFFDFSLNWDNAISPDNTILVTVSKNSPTIILGLFAFSGKFILETAVSISVLPFCIS